MIYHVMIVCVTTCGREHPQCVSESTVLVPHTLEPKSLFIVAAKGLIDTHVASGTHIH